MGACQSHAPSPGNSRSKSGRLVGRELSAFERLSWKATPYVTIAHWFQVLGPASPDDFAAALMDVHLHFAALQAIIENKRLFLRPDLKPEIEFDLERDVSPHALAQLGAEEASRGIAPTWQACEGKLLWRARIMKEGWLMLTFHHAIVDEKSICMLMKELVSILSGRERSSPRRALDPKLTQLLDEVPSGKLSQIMEQRKGGRLPGKAIGRLADVVPMGSKCNVERRQGKEWPKPDGLAPWQLRKTKTKVRRLPIARQLRQLCRARGLTVNTALLAGMALALRKQMKSKGKVGMRPILATDARNHIPDGQDLFGSYSLGARFRSGWGYLDVAEDTEFWDLASCAKLAVEDAGKKLEMHNISWYMRFLTAAMGKKDVAWLQGAMDLDGPDQGRTNALLLSNAGVLSGLESERFKVTQSFFASHQAAWGPFVWLNVMTIDDDMCLSLCYVDPLLADEKAATLLADVEFHLTRACAPLDRSPVLLTPKDESDECVKVTL
ncbi:unnamed protein product [Effrenium voratum]|uniref:Condensation domain-containing protein n=1 Tax=Effrenium voratum TaxID=2562239 RepID=A0AA36IEB6_9DINO|nr:unnamed protein product [Effrenium voratum]CAJ1438290.1 unnamed protein product [Effrenium voratum]